MRCLAILLALAVPAVGQVPDGRLAPKDPKAREKAVARGRAEADKQLKANEAKIWTYGLNHSLFFESVDRKTGLYYGSFGCVVDDEIEARVEGHNARIMESIRDHGPPKNSFKPWEKELFGLKDYFEGRSRSEKPVRLTVGGPMARSPDGKYVVTLVKVPGKSLEGEPIESNWLLVGERDTEENRSTLMVKDPELVWGPKGSWFAVLRGKSRSGDEIEYEAIDLREKRSIRLEFPPEPKSPVPPDPYDVHRPCDPK